MVWAHTTELRALVRFEKSRSIDLVRNLGSTKGFCESQLAKDDAFSVEPRFLPLLLDLHSS